MCDPVASTNALLGWLTRFKVLYGICKKVIVKGKELNTNMDAAENF